MFLRMKIWLYIWINKNMYGFMRVSTKLLYAQAWHETGDFKSKVFKENKNLFGMRHPSKRKTYSQGSNLAHAVYKSHWASIRDYFERQKYFGINDASDNEYMAQTVNSNYAEDANYLTKWQNVKNQVKMPFNNYVVLILFFFLIFTLIMIFKTVKQSKK